MHNGTGVPSLPPPSVLVVAAGAGESGAVMAGVNAAADRLRVTHALTDQTALSALLTGTFDCVLVDVGTPDARAVATASTWRTRVGVGALVLAVDDEGPHHDELDHLADLVLHTRDLAGGWLRSLRRAVEHGRLRSALRTAETSLARLSGVVESVADAVFTTTVDGIVTSWNGGARRLYGFTAEEMLGADVSMLHPPGSDEPRRIMSMLQRGESVRSLDTVRRTRDGRTAEVSVTVTPLSGAAGELAGSVVVARDISDRLELEAELARQTIHDTLTGLPNRAFLTHRLTRSLADARRRGTDVAVLVVDLDRFRALVEVHGHLAGDRVLAEVAGRLEQLARPADTVARLGDDEFVLVCPGTDAAAAARIAEQVIEAVSAPLLMDERRLQVGASVGIAVSPLLDGDAEALLKHADAAMYQAKARGRARSQVFDPDFARRAGEQRRLAGELRDALHEERLEVHYQPVVDLLTDEVVGIEALARWQHPVHDAVPPSTFVPLAEEHGFVAELDRWVLDRACHETAAALASGALAPHVRVAVNLSARSLDGPRVVEAVADVLHRSGLPPEALVLEVTETAVLQDRTAARTSLEGLRALGAGVSLDDFGTGYSSLSFLRELPVTVVKIDQSFVRNAAHRPEDLAIAEAIVRLARGLGLETVAEGIESAEQRDLLRRLGCASGQGFWWSPAVPLPALAAVRPQGLASGGAAPPGVVALREPIAGRGRRWPRTSRRPPQDRAADEERFRGLLEG